MDKHSLPSRCGSTKAQGHLFTPRPYTLRTSVGCPRMANLRPAVSLLSFVSDLVVTISLRFVGVRCASFEKESCNGSTAYIAFPDPTLDIY
jgi:hypothetical protein